MGAKHYTPEQVNKALGALVITARVVGGDWIPNFSVVGREIGISPRTLKRWWSAQSPQQIAELRRAASRARAKHLEAGAREVLEGQLAAVSQVVAYCLDPIHYSTELVKDGHKSTAADPVYRVAGTPPHHAARAALLCVEVLGELRKMQPSGEQGTTHRLKRLQRIRGHLARSKALDRTGGDE